MHQLGTIFYHKLSFMLMFCARFLSEKFFDRFKENQTLYSKTNIPIPFFCDQNMKF